MRPLIVVDGLAVVIAICGLRIANDEVDFKRIRHLTKVEDLPIYFVYLRFACPPAAVHLMVVMGVWELSCGLADATVSVLFWAVEGFCCFVLYYEGQRDDVPVGVFYPRERAACLGLGAISFNLASI